jgi:hypothetical protein
LAPRDRVGDDDRAIETSQQVVRRLSGSSARVPEEEPVLLEAGLPPVARLRETDDSPEIPEPDRSARACIDRDPALLLGDGEGQLDPEPALASIALPFTSSRKWWSFAHSPTIAVGFFASMNRATR